MSFEPKTCYISGAMRGYEECNFPLFDQAQKFLEWAGWTVFSPAAHDREIGFDAKGTTDCSNEYLAEAGFVMRTSILWDLQAIAQADAIILLPGWEGSSGAALELHFAKFLGLDVGYFEPDYWGRGIHSVDFIRDFVKVAG